MDLTAQLLNLGPPGTDPFEHFTRITEIEQPLAPKPVRVLRPQHRLEGVSGSAIRELGLDFITEVTRLRHETHAKFSIIGMGGVMTEEDVLAYRQAGADAVQSATGACLNPELPTEIVDDVILRNEPMRQRPRRFEKLFDVVATGGYSLLPSGSGNVR